MLNLRELFVYDLEIVNAIPTNEPQIPGITYCQGWEDYSNMGISVWAIGKFGPDLEPQIWSGTSVAEFKGWIDCLEANEIPYGGFNSVKFDDKLLKANGIKARSRFDILRMVLAAANPSNPGWQYWKEGLRYSMASIADANDLVKTLNGERAPIEWQQGNHDLVIDYCRNDVRIELLALKKLLEGDLIDPNTVDHTFPSKLYFGGNREPV